MPQVENGYTRIATELLDALISYRVAGEQMQCFLFILRKTYGFNKTEDYIALTQFMKATGMKKSAVCRALSKLSEKKIIVIKKDNKITLSYRINKYYKQWKPLTKKITLTKKIITVNKKDNLKLTKKSTTIDTLTIDNTTIDSNAPCTLKEWQEHFFLYANKYYSFPISRVRCDSLAHNSYEYWEEQKWLRNKEPMKSWKGTIETKVRRENKSLKDWDNKTFDKPVEPC